MRPLRTISRLLGQRLIERDSSLHGFAIKAHREISGHEIFNKFNGVIQMGIFEGVRILANTNWSGSEDNVLKILGIYEDALCTHLAKAIQYKSNPLLVVVGAADGYYAVGMAKRFPKLRVVAYESDPVSREEISKLIQLNDIPDGQIHVRQEFGKGELRQESFGEDHILLFDIEGAEFSILDREGFALLGSSSVFVEVHENSNEGKSAADLILAGSMTHFGSRLKGSTNVEHFRNAPYIRDLSDDKAFALLSEGRPSPSVFVEFLPRN